MANRDIEYFTSRMLEIAEHAVPVDENIFQIILARNKGRLGSYKYMVSMSPHCKMFVCFA